MLEKKEKSLVIVLFLVIALVGIVAGLLMVGQSFSSEKITQSERKIKYWKSSMDSSYVSDKPGKDQMGMDLIPVYEDEAAKLKPTGGKKIKYWKSSMDPAFVSDKPGKDQMGMDLIPVYEDEVQEEGIKISPVTAQNMGLRTAVAEERQLTRTIRMVANIDYNEKLLHTINTKISGWIEKLYVQNTGDPVKKGQPLLEIYAPELVSTQEEYLTALKNFQELKDSPYPEVKQGATELLQSTKQRLLYWDISPEQIDELDKTGEVKKTLILYSPAKGIVIEKNVIEGSSVNAGSDLFKIADLSTVWLLGHIYEYELPYVEIGQTTHIQLPYSPGEELSGKISYIYPYLNETTRDVKVRIELPNPESKLKPGMYANVTIASELPGKRVVIPEEAIIRSGKREIVFIDEGGGKYSPREVVTGVSGEGNVTEIKQGLMPGEKVVVSAQFMLDSESKTQEAIKKMLEKGK